MNIKGWQRSACHRLSLLCSLIVDADGNILQITRRLFGTAYETDAVARFCAGVGVNSDTPCDTCLIKRAESAV